jgi:hypothetical protein
MDYRKRNTKYTLDSSIILFDNAKNLQFIAAEDLFSFDKSLLMGDPHFACGNFYNHLCE